MHKPIRHNILLVLLFALLVVSTGSCITVNVAPESAPKPTSPQISAPVTPTPPLTPPPSIKIKPVVTTFAISPATVNFGQPTTLSWAVSNATIVSIDNGLGTVPSTGSMVINPSKTIVFTLTATNEGGSVTASTQVSVSSTSTGDQGLPVINSFTAKPQYLFPGDSSILSWAVSNATEVTIDNDVGVVPIAGTRPVKPAVTTNYTIKATNGAGWRSMTIIVFVR